MLMQSIQLILCVSTLIIIHELGHFFIAKLFNVKVEKFVIFFDPWFSIINKKIGETIYSIGWIPLGGYIKISGMVNDKNNSLTENQDTFYSKSLIKRLLIVSGGVITNIIFSIIIFSFLLFQYGEINIPTKSIIYGMEVSKLGYKIGLKNGDKILSVDNNIIPYYNDINKSILLGDKIVIDRQGVKKNFSFSKRNFFDEKKINLFLYPRVPAIINKIIKKSNAEKYGLKFNDEIININYKPIIFQDQLKNQLIDLNIFNKKYFLLGINRNGKFIQKKIFFHKKNIIGFYLKGFQEMKNIFLIRKQYFSFLESFKLGLYKTWNVLHNQIFFLKNIFHPETKAYKQVGSFISIANEFSINWDWYTFWFLTGTLSIWLAFINLFPIPSLDGGYILFILLELILGKKLSEKIYEHCSIFGFLIITIIMITVMIWDIFKFFFN